MTTPNEAIHQQKVELRKQIQVARNTLRSGSSDTRASAFALNAMQFVKSFSEPGDVIALFVSLGYEPPTDILISTLDDLGYGILLPRVLNDSHLDWYRYDGQWSVDKLGISAPDQTRADLTHARIVFIPAFAASNDGRRLGRGKGFYDRALAAVAEFHDGGPYRIAVTDMAGLLEPGLIPIEAHDQLVNAVLVG